MSASPRIGLSYILPQQAQKHVTANESFRVLDALVHLRALSRSVSAEPVAPAEGDAYILPAGATGAAWSAFGADSIAAFQDGAWTEIEPGEGWRAFVADNATFLVHDGAAWLDERQIGGTGEFDRLGVNASADATNKLSVKSDAILVSHDDVTPGTGDARIVVNKDAATGTASVLFQTGFSGRAEFGLTGSDDFNLKVSGDGAVWKDALIVKSDGKVGVGTTAPAAPFELHVDGAAVAPSLISLDDFIIAKESNAASFAGIIASDVNRRMVFKGARARGNLAAPTAVALDDYTFSLLGAGFDGSDGKATAGIEFRIDGAVSAGVVPQRIMFMTGEAASRVERMRITADGKVGIGATAPSTSLHVEGPVRVKSYTVAGVPSASGSGAGAILYVSNETGGAVLAFSDGANWRRVTDRAVVS